MNINQYMKKYKMKNHDFAKFIGIAQGYLSQIRHGDRKPSRYLALIIESKTNGEIKAKDLRSDIELV